MATDSHVKRQLHPLGKKEIEVNLQTNAALPTSSQRDEQ